MTEPVLVIHGVNVRDREGFEKQVTDLNRRVGSQWAFFPVYWGDLGAGFLGIEDTIPGVRSMVVRGGESSPDFAIVEDLLAGEAGAPVVRSAAPGWEVVAEAAARRAAPASPVRGFGGNEEIIREAIREVWPQTRTLQYLTDAGLLEEIGLSIGEGIEEGSQASSALVRGPIADEIRELTRGITRGIDSFLGRIIARLLGNLNTFLRTRFGPEIGRFLGDIFVYENQRRSIRDRLFERLDREAPGWGTEQRPINVIAHSLGGVVCFDTAVTNVERRLFIKRFVTFGSQSAFFHVVNPRGSITPYQPGTPVRLPSSIGRWTSLWEPLDPLAFLAGKVFRLSSGDAPRDVEVPHLQSSGLWTHSVYWTHQALVDAIRQTFG